MVHSKGSVHPHPSFRLQYTNIIIVNTQHHGTTLVVYVHLSPPQLPFMLSSKIDIFSVT